MGTPTSRTTGSTLVRSQGEQMQAPCSQRIRYTGPMGVGYTHTDTGSAFASPQSVRKTSAGLLIDGGRNDRPHRRLRLQWNVFQLAKTMPADFPFLRALILKSLGKRQSCRHLRVRQNALRTQCRCDARRVEFSRRCLKVCVRSGVLGVIAPQTKRLLALECARLLEHPLPTWRRGFDRS